MVFTEEQLIRKKKEIENAKQEHAQLIGERKGLLQQLNEDFGCKDLETAKKKIEKMEIEMQTINTEIKERTEILEQTYFNED